MIAQPLIAQRGMSPALEQLRNEKDPAALKLKLEELGKGGEEELNLLTTYYRISGNNARADSLRKKIIARYPKGTLAFVEFQNTLYATQGGEEQEAYYLANKDRFPDNNSADRHYYSIAAAFARDRNLKKMKEYFSRIKDAAYRSTTTRLLARTVLTFDLNEAEAMCEPEVEALYIKGFPPERDTTITGLDERRPHYLEFMDMFSTILIRKGKFEKALKYAKAAYDNNTSKSDLRISNYAFLLYKTGRSREAFPLLADIVESGKANHLKDALKETFQQLNPEKDAEAYIKNVEKNMTIRIREETVKKLVNEATPAFTVKDINGRTVSLADLAGKIIVVDFWATWCGPCVKSFPAMQRVVNLYEKDSTVKFLFIHTWEKVSNPKADAITFLTRNNFKLDLYMDEKDARTGLNPAVNAFGVRGIPAKFVIDSNGRTRFKMTGFAGGDDAAVAELSTMIEIARAEKN